MKVPIQNNQSLKSDVFELLQKSAELDSSLKWRPNCISFEGNQCNKVGCNHRRSQLPKPISMTNSSSVLSRVAASSKTRIRWTQDLHNQFVECVNRLGAADKATPEEILKIMDASGLTILQVKSHLQVFDSLYGNRCAEVAAPSLISKGKSDRTHMNQLTPLDLKTGFKETLGKGAFGTVYKGVLPSDSKRFVAVKKLGKVVEEGEKEFKTEVSVIGQTHHKNLVRLLGYCDEGQHRLLVYEYMSNGSLASFLFGISRPHWNQRVQIAFGIARGLMYLHEECSTQIIHCDIKPQNILLDEYFTPRIADFGLAKLLLAEQSRAARTAIRGTIGYFAPEWFSKASISVKVDVYSFGVMLLEIICCKSSVAFALGEEEALIDWAYECYKDKKLDKLIEDDEEAKNDMKRLERFVIVAIWCIQEDSSLRPSMKKVTQMLEGVIEVSVPPSPSLFTSSPPSFKK
nr:g-type lectin s-receptor-like serine/threonine-protein kinase rlk1 [Quercus suber]